MFSLRNFSWKLDEHDVVKTRQLELKHNISPLLARCLMPIMNKIHKQVLQTHALEPHNTQPKQREQGRECSRVCTPPRAERGIHCV